MTGDGVTGDDSPESSPVTPVLLPAESSPPPPLAVQYSFSTLLLSLSWKILMFLS